MSTFVNVRSCSECGHLHFDMIEKKYEACPVADCPCLHAKGES